ncbi:flagellar filament capping protein FliD [Novosphingobium sp.]|uniref:flagellar filament capping protein FliD n=1 Tax=Novosphingobium sp. TaxID=1874826 RepID=UPI003D0E3194
MTSVSSTSSTGTTTPVATTSSSTSATSVGSATQALLTELGVSGNINASSLADQLSTAEYSGQVDHLNSNNSTLGTQISDASSLMNMMSTLTSSLDSLINAGSLSSQPQIANSAVATVSAGTVSGSGTATLEVDTLAQGQTIASQSIPATTTDVGSGSLTITLGTVSGTTFTAGSKAAITVNVGAGDTLAQLASAINHSGAGVSAYVATNSTGQQLVITGPQGAANAFTISASEDAADPGLAKYAYSPSTTGTSGGATLAAPATDASYILNGVSRTATSNSITDAAPGISLNLTGTNVGSPTSISFTSPTSAINSAMTDLVTALNSIVGTLNTDTAIGGPLNNNPGARAMMQALSSLSSIKIMPDATAGQPSTLGDLGLTTNRDGTFTLDATVLGKAIGANSAAVTAMFTTGIHGVYGTIYDLSASFSDPTNPNSLAGSSADLTRQQTANTTLLAKIATEQATLRTTLLAQFSALNAAVTADKSTQSFLTQQIALWTNSSSTTGG